MADPETTQAAPGLPPPREMIERGDVSGVRVWAATVGTDVVHQELERLDPATGALLFRMLPKGQELSIFESLDPAHQQDLLAGLRDEQVRRVVEGLDPDDRARLLDEMPAGLARRLLQEVSPAERRMTATLLGYPDDSVGRIMSPEVLRLAAGMPVGDALIKVNRRGARAETVDVLPVTDDEMALLGSVRLADLVLADPQSRVGALLRPGDLRASVHDNQEQAARRLQDAGARAIPVVDVEGRLVGILTADDAMDVLEQATSEDFARAGGAEPLRRPYFTSSVMQLARSRAAWLLVLIVAATLTINVLQAFEGALEQVIALALFIPLLIDTGGNAGAQASTTMVRSLALGDVRAGDALRIAWREARVGVMLGAMLAVLGFLPVSFIFGGDIAIVVALTLITVVTLASTVGAVLPLMAHRVGIDPAIVSAPLVTTLVDATGLLVYFLIATAVLGL
jgi:magnesium transporter